MNTMRRLCASLRIVGQAPLFALPVLEGAVPRGDEGAALELDRIELEVALEMATASSVAVAMKLSQAAIVADGYTSVDVAVPEPEGRHMYTRKNVEDRLVNLPYRILD